MKINEAVEQVTRGFDTGRLAQGYVIAEQSPGASAQLVDDLLQLFFCTAEEKPCCTCRGCLQALDHSHVDLFWVSPQKKSRIIPVDTIRQIEGKIYMTSYTGGWKVCVIESADRMKEQAANAFLKTLEEPPAKTIFFLLTDSPQFLLPTIVSRCQRINVSGASDTVVEEWHEPVLEILSDVGRNKPIGDFALTDRMLRVLNELKAEAEKEENERWKNEAVEEDDTVLDARISARYRGKRTKVVRFMMTWFRDLFLLVNGADDSSVIQNKQIDVISEMAKKLDYRSAMNNLSVVEDLNRQLEGNITEKSVFNLAFSRLR